MFTWANLLGTGVEYGICKKALLGAWGTVLAYRYFDVLVMSYDLSLIRYNIIAMTNFYLFKLHNSYVTVKANEVF